MTMRLTRSKDLRQGSTWSKLAPVAESQVAVDQQTRAFVAADLEQQFGSGPAQGQEIQFVPDQQIAFVELYQ